MIVALAGRRIDKANADRPRFPLTSVGLVSERLGRLFSEKKASTLVCSAACGADLLALQAAGNLGIRRRIVLPFARSRFRETSVLDRPGDWGPLFDAICDEVVEEGDLVSLDCSDDDPCAYSAASSAILEEALRLQRTEEHESVVVVIVWEGAARGEDDETAAFAKKAEALGIDVEETLTT